MTRESRSALATRRAVRAGPVSRSIVFAMWGVVLWPPDAAAQVELVREDRRPRPALMATFAGSLGGFGSWNAALDEFEAVSRDRGLATSSTFAPGTNISLSVRRFLLHKLAVGFELGRWSRESGFTVVEADQTGGGLGTYRTATEAWTTVLTALAAYYPSGAVPGWKPVLEFGAGWGSGSISFRTPGGRASGAGSGFAASASVGAERTRGRFVLAVAAGARFHPFSASYDQADYSRGTGDRFLFGSTPEFQIFVLQQDFSFTGVFLRAGAGYRL